MKLRSLPIDGALLLEPEGDADRRGFFTRGWCRRLLEDRGLEPALARSDVLVHHNAGEIRAPRCLAPPFEEAMLARCTRGSVHVVLVAMHAGEPGTGVTSTGVTGTVVTAQLDATSRHGIYIPPGIAFGYQTLEAEAEVFVQYAEVPTAYTEEHRLDPASIDWPLPAAPG